MEIYVKVFFSISICSLYSLVFKHDLIRSFDFTRIAASNTASDGVTNYVTHRIFNTDLLYSCAHFIVKIVGKFSLDDGF